MHMHQVDPSSKLIGSNFDLGSQGSKGFFTKKRGDLVHPPNLTRALGKGRMSSLFWFHVSKYRNFWNNERWKSCIKYISIMKLFHLQKPLSKWR